MRTVIYLITMSLICSSQDSVGLTLLVLVLNLFQLYETLLELKNSILLYELLVDD